MEFKINFFFMSSKGTVFKILVFTSLQPDYLDFYISSEQF